MSKANILCAVVGASSVSFLSPQSHTYTHTGKPTAKSTTVQLGSLLPQVVFAYWDQLQQKNETNCPEWYKFPRHAWGTRQLVSVMCFFARPVDARHLMDNMDLIFNFPREFAETAMTLITQQQWKCTIMVRTCFVLSQTES